MALKMCTYAEVLSVFQRDLQLFNKDSVALENGKTKINPPFQVKRW